MNKSKYRLPGGRDDRYARLSRSAAILGAVPFAGAAALDAGAGDPFRAADAQATGAPRGLTAQERRVVDELRRGVSNRQIARTLQLSESTIKFHLRNIFDKLGVRSRMQVLLWSVAAPRTAAAHGVGIAGPAPGSV